MEPAMMMAPIMMSYMMTSVAPIALMMTGGEFDRERIARGIAQFTVVSLRSVVDITYDDMLLDDRTGDFSIRGLEIELPEAAGLPGCKVTIDALTIVSMGRPDVLAFSSEADGLTIDPACAADQGPMILSMLGPDAMNVTHYSATTSYHLGSSSLDYSLLLETAAAGSVSLNARLDGLYLEQGNYGDPMPAGELTQLEVTLQDTESLRELLPVLGLEDDPVAMATGTMQGMLSKDGISAAEQALIDSANAELSRVVKDGGAVTLRSGPGVAVSFKQMEQTNGPEDMVALLQPVFTSALVGADKLISSDLLKQAMTAPDDLSAEKRLMVATALTTGEGVPRSAAMAASLLQPLAESGDATAALRYAQLLHAEGTDSNAAYRHALKAGAGEAAGVRSVLDRIESDMPLSAILEIQASVAGDMAEPEADVSMLRNSARRYAQGRGAARNYGHALFLANLAGAAGDHSSQQLLNRLSSRFAEDEEAAAWRALEEAQASAALELWSQGFGDGFAAK